jgi:putative effector of murein hydrolase LrgA (UPF0299 family)
MITMDWFKKIDWTAWLFLLLLIVVFREAAVWVMTALHYPELGNLVGLLSLLVFLFIWRRLKGLPARLIETNNTLMRESAFAFLPICAGSVIMLMQMGNKLYAFMVVLCVSTLFPLWLYAKLAKRWL